MKAINIKWNVTDEDILNAAYDTETQELKNILDIHEDIENWSDNEFDTRIIDIARNDNDKLIRLLNLPPTELDIPDNIVVKDKTETPDDHEIISNYITDTTNLCHEGFDLKE